MSPSNINQPDIEKAKILLVDDRPENLFALKQVLKKLDVTLIEAGSGDEALEKILDHTFALALLDVQMPGMDGFELATIIREHDATAKMPIIFATAINKEERYIHAGYDSGAVDYLSKPIDPHILLSKVSIFLELHQQKQALINEIAERKRIEAMKDELVSIVSHELRTPLTAIKGSLGLLLHDKQSQYSERATQLLNIGSSNCERLLRMISGLLDVQKIEAGKQIMQTSSINVANFLQDAKNANSSYGVKYTVVFNLEPSVETMLETFIAGDVDQLLQVMANLLSNAAKFSHPKGKVYIGANKDNGKVTISVRDEGLGMPEDFKQHIFEKFSQANNNDKLDEKGTGLGMSISKAIIEEHGGTLTVESTLNEGSTFTFVLDEAPAPSTLTPQTPPNFIKVQP